MSGILRFKRLLLIPGRGVAPRRFSAVSEASVVSSEANPRQQISNEGAEQSGDGNGGGFQNKERYATRFLKFLLGGTFTAASATAAYASYAYTTEEIEQMTASMRNSTTYTVPDDASALDRVRGFLYSTTMAVPAKATELYLDARRTIEDYVKGFAAPSSDKLLPDLAPQEQHVFTLVLDLN